MMSLTSEVVVKTKLILVSLISVLLNACAGGSGGSNPSPNPQPTPNPLTCSTFQGVYDNNYYAGQTLTINNDCTFTDSICGYTAGFSVPDQQSGATTINVIGTNGTPGCMSSTAHACEIYYDGQSLDIACDNQTIIYSFERQ